jgi:acyl carrier protein
MLELIAFLEQEYGLQIADTEMLPDNLDGIARIAAFVARKSASVPAAS